MELGSDGEINIVIKRMTYGGEPTHWEVDASMTGKFIDGYIEGTAPTLNGVTDMVYEYLGEIDKDSWAVFDANARNYE